MALLPKQDQISAAIDAAWSERADEPRPHLGASMLGHPCDRYLWLSFRWAFNPQHSGRTLRIFERGRREEPHLAECLRMIGVELSCGGDEQYRVDFGGHVSGSIDGIAESGVPGAEKTRHVVEFKTHSDKSFSELEKKGVQQAKPLHYAQMQAYMIGTGIDRALYVAVNKNDDAIYTERIALDMPAAQRLVERGHRIVSDPRMPLGVSTSPAWYQCKMCDAYQMCHGSQTTENVNCRTCAHSTPMPDSTWRCERHDADEIPLDFQRAGCGAHVLHPDLVPWQRIKTADQWEATYCIAGADYRNGEGDAHVYTSRELLDIAKSAPAQSAEISDDDIPF